MLIALALIAVALLIALAVWWLQRGKRGNRPPAAAARAREVKRPAENYHSVELRAGPDACAAVKRIGAKRFLTREAPGIPVPGCDAAHCTCAYVHHKDRRQGDRRHPHPQLAALPPAAEGDRRTKRDRRRAAKNPPRTKAGDRRSTRRGGAGGS